MKTSEYIESERKRLELERYEQAENGEYPGETAPKLSPFTWFVIALVLTVVGAIVVAGVRS